MKPEPIYCIEVRYADLRRTAESVLAFVQTQYGGRHSSLQTRLEADLGVTGDDAEELMLRFAAAYQVDLSRFRFDRHFHPETSAGLTGLIFLMVLLAGVLLKTVLAAGVCLVSRPLALKIWRFRIAAWINTQLARMCARRTTYAPQPEDLRIGDLAAAAAVRAFVRREDVRFVLLRP